MRGDWQAPSPPFQVVKVSPPPVWNLRLPLVGHILVMCPQPPVVLWAVVGGGGVCEVECLKERRTVRESRSDRQNEVKAEDRQRARGAPTKSERIEIVRKNNENEWKSQNKHKIGRPGTPKSPQEYPGAPRAENVLTNK